MSDQHLITTRAKGKTCPRCRRPVLTGIAEGLEATVDLIPLDAAAELAMLLTGRRTYSLLAGELTYRDKYRISGGLRGVVLAAHQCPPSQGQHITQEPLFELPRRAR